MAIGMSLCSSLTILPPREVKVGPLLVGCVLSAERLDRSGPPSGATCVNLAHRIFP